MKTFVISLPGSCDRRDFMSSQMEYLDLMFEFFDAVDGRKMSDTELQACCSFKWQKRYQGYELSKSEIGCALSHLLLYEKIVREKIPVALILEDDAYLTPSIKPVLAALGKMPVISEPAVWLFSEGTLTDWRRFIPVLKPYAYAPAQHAFFTHCYVVTYPAAERLLRRLRPVAHVADCWNWISLHRIIQVYSIKPILATQNNCCCRSTIADERVEALAKMKLTCGVTGWVRHKSYRVFWLLVDKLMAACSRISRNRFR